MIFLATNLPALPEKSHGILFWVGVALVGLIAAFIGKIINTIILMDIDRFRSSRTKKKETKHHKHHDQDKEKGIY